VAVGEAGEAHAVAERLARDHEVGNRAVGRRRRDERQIACDDPELEALAAAAVHASVQQGGYADLFTRFDLSEAIDRAIAELPDAFRDVVLLIDVNDQSYETAAAALGVPIGTVRSRLFRARRLLQETLINHARDAGFVRSSIDEEEAR